MTSAERLRPYAAGMLFGGYAAAIALAPTLTQKALFTAPAILLPVAWWILAAPYRWLALFFATALLLPPLPVAIGDSGPHLCLALAAFGLLAGAFRLRDWRLDFSGPGAPLVALFAILLASVASAAYYSGFAAALSSLARVALFGISVYIYFYPRAVNSAGAPRVAASFISELFRRSSPAWISTSNSPRPPDTNRNSCGSNRAYFAAHRESSTKPARWAISARFSWR